MNSNNLINDNWKITDLKSKGRKTFHRNYWRALLVALILAVFAGAHVTISTKIDSTNTTLLHFNGNSNTAAVNEFLTRIGWGDDSLLSHVDSDSFEAREGGLATVLDNVSRSNSFLFGMLNAINDMAFHGKVWAGVIVLLGATVGFLYWTFICNPLRIGEIRFFLESRSYPDTQINRILYLFRIKRVVGPSMIMLLRGVFTLLWCLTIVGGPIKFYSYRMIPYIIAENPDIGCKEAFRLSMDMMNGNKWRTFLLDFSFILWYVGSFITFGLLAIAYVTPFKMSTNAELYMALRQQAIDSEHSLYEELADPHLAAAPTSLPGEQYPIHLYHLPESSDRKWLAIDYIRNYSIENIIIIFFAFSFLGWVWEVGLYLVNEGHFINRGVFLGPWLPIYGAGGVLILLALKKWRSTPVKLFLMAMLLSGIVEYTTAWALETFLHQKWWDYSGFMFNIQGRVCLERLILFALGGCMFTYVLAPLVDTLLNKLPRSVRIGIASVLTACFAADIANAVINGPNTGDGITN